MYLYSSSFFSQIAAYLISNPLVTMIIIGDYSNSTLPSIELALNDYYNIIKSFNNVCGYGIVIPIESDEDEITDIKQMKKGEIMSIDDINNCKFKLSWTFDEILDFNSKVKKQYIENRNYGYDSLIYLISCHGSKNDIIYDSNGESIPLSYIYSQFNNKNCKQLRQKPKIYLCDTNRVLITNKNTAKQIPVVANLNHHDHGLPNLPNTGLMDVIDEEKENKASQEQLTRDTMDTNQYLNRNSNVLPTPSTYTEENHCRKVFGHSAQQAIIHDSNYSQIRSNHNYNGSILIRCLGAVLKNNFSQLESNGGRDLSQILFETRKYMALILNIPQNNTDIVSLHDCNTMPYPVKLDVNGNLNDSAVKASLNNTLYGSSTTLQHVCICQYIYNYTVIAHINIHPKLLRALM